MRLALQFFVRWPRSLYWAFAALIILAFPAGAEVEEPVDLDAVYRIKDEGFERSEVMEIASYLTDVYGPRLTGSPGLQKASGYALRKLEEWDLSNVEQEPWGRFGRGWSNERFSAHMRVDGIAYPLIGYPRAWTPGTEGPATGEARIAVIEKTEDFDNFRGKLQGKFVLTAPMREVEARFEAQGRRYTESDLARITSPRDPARRRRERGDVAGRREFRKKRMQFFLDEGVAALLEPGRGDGGTVFVSGGGSRDPEDPRVPVQIVLAVEHYGRITRLLEKDVPVTIEMDIANRFYDDDLTAYNVVAEIPGTDKADEVVMFGAHLDSWHTGTGATDNAAGCAVTMEAMRILKASGLRMRRTVRLVLWTGEEQGLLGSRAYVKQHFADPETMELKPEHGKFAAYFNVDNGTGAIRGVYVQRNEAVAPVFERWMLPFRNLGATTLSFRNTGGTDHLPFDAVGLPGFQFIQDPVEYGSRTHHSNMDLFERIQAGDVMKNSVIVASFVYHAANRDERLPRKPLPDPG